MSLQVRRVAAGPGPYNVVAWNIHSSKHDMSLLDLRLTYQKSSWWNAKFGYREMAATSIALTTNQISPDSRGLGDFALIHSNGSLILHGAYAGVEFAR